MIFDKKIKRGMDIMNERNRQYLEKEAGMDSEGNNDDASVAEQPNEEENAARRAEEYRRLNSDSGLEKGDIPALIISALLVFSPIFLVLIGIMVLAWIFLS